MDIISKDQAIDSICINICGKSHNDCGFWKKNFEFCNACKFAFLVGSTPSAEKVGEWLIPQRRGVMSWNEKAYAECSVCHEVTFNARSMKFCPQCGAKMENDNE